jgi:transcriptional regulator with XRE-family HTH domain
MPTSQTLILDEIIQKPIPLRTRLLYRRRLQNQIQRMLRTAFRDEQKRTGLTQKELAERIGKDKSKVNQWLSIASNLTLETISDLLLGLGVDLDELSFTPFRNLVDEAAPKQPEPPSLAIKLQPVDSERAFWARQAAHAGQSPSTPQGFDNEEIYGDQSAINLLLSSEYLRNSTDRRPSGRSQSEISISPLSNYPRTIESAESAN